MKKYFIDRHMTYCYPYKTRQRVENYGVLAEYIGKYFSRDEMDKIICELIMRHPYIEHSMFLEISIMCGDESCSGYYHILSFRNDNDETQVCGDMAIKYEK